MHFYRSRLFQSKSMAKKGAKKAAVAAPAPPPKAMKAMKAKAMKSGVLTQTQVIASVAETDGLKNKQMKGVIDALFGVATSEIKNNGNFKLTGMLNLKLKKKSATPAKKGINPFIKEPCVSKAKPASKTVRELAMKKLKEASS